MDAKVLSVQEEGLLFKRFKFKEVCSHFNVIDALIPSKVNEKEIDCMGRNFSIEKFCEDKFSDDKKYTRARFNISNDEVNCHFSQTSIVSIECEGEHLVLCKDTDLSCKTIKKHFAYNHEFTKSTLQEISPANFKCFYQSTEKIIL